MRSIYMKKHILMLIVLINATISAAVENSANQQEFSLQYLIHQAKSIEFNKESPEVGAAYFYFNGQNIVSAMDNDYIQGFYNEVCSVEMLYGLYLALQGFLLPEGQGFTPESLNDGFTQQNYDFLKKIFGES
jgi:hypothetical protein